MRALSHLLALVVIATLVVAQPAVAATTVCAVYCDTRDPSLASQELFPVPERSVNGRRIVLHVSNTDSMAWGSIDNGVPGDGVWLDRSWDGGATWDGLLGKATIPATWTGTRTLMYNLSDPSHHRRGVVRACGDGQGIVCTDWVYPAVCAPACDNALPGGGSADSRPVPDAWLNGRSMDDRDRTEAGIARTGHIMLWCAVTPGHVPCLRQVSILTYLN